MYICNIEIKQNVSLKNTKKMVNHELNIMLAGYGTFIGTEWRVYNYDTVVYSSYDYDAALKEYRKLESKKMADAN